MAKADRLDKLPAGPFLSVEVCWRGRVVVVVVVVFVNTHWTQFSSGYLCTSFFLRNYLNIKVEIQKGLLVVRN